MKQIEYIMNKSYMPFLFLTIVMFVFHLLIPVGTGDDIFFSKVLNDYSILSFCFTRYNTWSSRIIIESILIVVSRFPIMWKILDVLVVLWICKSISNILNHEKEQKITWFIVFALIMFPWESMGSAGWIATTMNYLWPLASGLYVLSLMTEFFRGNKVSYFKIFLSVPCLLYACNQEQICAVMVAFLFFGLVLCKLKTHKFNSTVIFWTILSLLSLCFIMFCPGNAARNIAETSTHFPEYAEFTLLDKLDIGFSSAFFPYITEIKVLYFLFICLLCIYSYKKRGFSNAFVAAIIPLTVSVFLGIFGSTVLSNTVIVQFINNGLIATGTTTIVVNLLILFILVLVCTSIWLSFDDKMTAFVLIYILGVGFATRMVMGFSPTIWASGNRTYMFLEFAFLLVSTYLFTKVININNTRNILNAVLICTFSLCCIHWLILILT